MIDRAFRKTYTILWFLYGRDKAFSAMLLDSDWASE